MHNAHQIFQEGQSYMTKETFILKERRVFLAVIVLLLLTRKLFE